MGGTTNRGTIMTRLYTHIHFYGNGINEDQMSEIKQFNLAYCDIVYRLLYWNKFSIYLYEKVDTAMSRKQKKVKVLRGKNPISIPQLKKDLEYILFNEKLPIPRKNMKKIYDIYIRIENENNI